MKPYNPADFPFVIGQIKACLMHVEARDRVKDILGDISGPEFIYYVDCIVKSFYENDRKTPDHDMEGGMPKPFNGD